MNNETTQPAHLSADKQALLVIQRLQEKYAATQKARKEPIAIIGMDCRFPGGANNPELFWQLLCDGRDAVSPVPPERWNSDQFYDPDLATPGKMNSRVGAFLDQVDKFDAAFFNIPPREAISMDPQQRIFLEVAWNALERAGQTMDHLSGSDTGVFVGVANQDYYHIQLQNDLIDGTYTETGNRHSFLSGRLSYVFNFKGPSVTVDTVCSSSLVAVHLACQSLRNRETGLAVAGSANVILSPTFSILASKLRILSPSGHCKTFDEQADGFVRGEGCGAVILKRLSDALAAGDPILAVIRGSAINQDGRSTALTAPNVLSQQALLQQAAQNADVDLGLISYVETHGTGTQLGDPIEFTALAATIGKARTNGLPCYLGAVKTNIGHLEAASGMASLIKTILCLQHQTIPPNLHFEKLNPHISLDQTPFIIPLQTCNWSTKGLPRFAGVSAFGLSGTNAHVILAEAPDALSLKQESTTHQTITQLLPISARSPEALRASMLGYIDFLAESTENIQTICSTAALRRSHHHYRATLVGQTPQALIDAARTDLEMQKASLASPFFFEHHPRCIFIFPGQGSQWLGMARDLWESEILFREAMQRCEKALAPFVSWSLSQVLMEASQEFLERIDVIQPLLFALQISLVELWSSWGIKPDAVIGHSMGEVAAATVAGALSLEDAAKIIAVRSQLLKHISGQGAMLLVELSWTNAQQIVAPVADLVSVAVSNSQRSTVLAGDPTTLELLKTQLEQQQIFCRWVKVDVASHSPQVDILREKLLTQLQSIQPQPLNLPMFSTVRANTFHLDASYWVENLREPVRFSHAIEQACSEGYTTFVEISTHPILVSAIEEGLASVQHTGLVVGSLRRNEEGRLALLTSLGKLYAQGYTVNWQRIYAQTATRVTNLPAYPWQRERFWIDTQNTPSHNQQYRASYARSGHPFLSQPLPLAGLTDQFYWSIDLTTDNANYLQDHRVHTTVVLPGTVYIDLALTVGKELFAAHPFSIEELHFKDMMVLHATRHPQRQLVLKKQSQTLAAFQFFSQEENAGEQASLWKLHTDGYLRAIEEEEEEASWLFTPRTRKGQLQAIHPTLSLAAIQQRCAKILTREHYYQTLAEHGLHYGPGFQGIQKIWRCNGEALAHLQLPASLTTDIPAYQIHPALLDAGLQTLMAAIVADDAASASHTGTTYLPVQVDQLRFYKSLPLDGWAHVTLQSQPDSTHLIGDVFLFDMTGQIALTIQGLHVQRLEAPVQNAMQNWFYTPQWVRQDALVPEVTSSKHATQSKWLIFSDETSIQKALHAHIYNSGDQAILVNSGMSYEYLGENHYRINPAHPEDFQRLLQEIYDTHHPLVGVIYLWSLNVRGKNVQTAYEEHDTHLMQRPLARYATQTTMSLWQLNVPIYEEATATDLLQAQSYVTESVISLVQALALTGWRYTPRLWLITQGVQPIEHTPSQYGIAQAPLWGLAQTLLYEQPSLRCSRIDLSAWLAPTELTQLCRICTQDEPENQIVLRGKKRYVARLHHYTPGGKGVVNKQLFRADGSYLLIGGLGGVGLTIAGWMVERGARELFLVGRTEPSEQAQKILMQLRQSGAQLHCMQADIADEQQVSHFLAQIRTSQFPPLRGIFHMAAVLDDITLSHMQQRHLATVMRPKLQGAWHLHTQTLQDPLDYFVLFSSAASLLGSPGQANYGAANAFLDALAQQRCLQELPALSINWGPWSDIGLAAAQADRGHRLAMMGISSFSPLQGVTALEWLLTEKAPAQVGVVPFNLRQWQQSYPAIANLPFFTNLGQEQSQKASSEISLRASLEAMSPSDQQELLEKHLREQIAQVLRLAPAKIGRQTSFSLLGLESLVAVELRNRLENSLDLALPVTIVWTYSTLQTLAEHLLEKLAIFSKNEMVVELLPEMIHEGETTTKPVATKIPREETHDFSKEEISQLLLEELRGLSDEFLNEG